LEPGRRVRLVFDTGFAFIKQLRMPLAALPHLKSALTLQLPKWLPMNPALLTTDFAIVALDPEHSAFELELAAIKLADIEPVANALRRWGFRLSSVHLGGRAEAPPRFRFPTYDSHTRRFAITRVDSVLLGTAAVLGVADMVVSAVQAYRAQSALDQAQMLTVAEAGMVMEQRQRLLARLEPLSVLSSHERSVGAAAILAEVTARVPQDTWLTTFELKGRTLRLVGLSADVANVVKLLTDSPELAGVELRTSISAGLGTGKDRFEITAEVKGGA
jgi:Tfp pilus assembly protein PilN